MIDLFFELIRISIGTQESISRVPSPDEWSSLFDMAQKQSLVGICFVGVQKVCDSDAEYYCGMTESQYLTWMGMAANIQRNNLRLSDCTMGALSFFRGNGIPCYILKGQGIAKIYGNLQPFRQSGDVDLWVNCSRRRLYGLSMSEFGQLSGVTYHHIHFPLFSDCEIEAHIYPSYRHNFVQNHLLHHFFDEYVPTDGCNDSPPLAFNRVFILLHIYNHFCGRGIGLRQLLDYYFVLKEGVSDVDRVQTVSWLEKLGLLRFASATMWLMKHVFFLSEEYFLCVPNEKDGRFMLSEVIQTGNMGYGDDRVDRRLYNTAAGRYYHNVCRDFHVAKLCPGQAFWEPLWGIYQFVKVKRIKHKYRY